MSSRLQPPLRFSNRAPKQVATNRSRLRIGIYLRISTDPDGTQEATARQLADCQRWAELQGHEVVDIYEDVDVSGYKKVTRPQFDRMLEDMRVQRIDACLAWRVERLLRNWRDWARLVELYDETGTFCLTEDGHDSRDTGGVNPFALFVWLSEAESKKISERTRRKHKDSASKGLPHRGGSRPFCYTDGGRETTVVEECALVHEAYERMLVMEETPWAICKDWNRRGLHTSRGKPWNTVSFRVTMTSPHLAGLRSHYGEVYEGTWDPVVAREDLQRMISYFEANRGKRGAGRRARYLLVGLARCGLCGEKMYGRPDPRQPASAVYMCVKRPGSANCGRVSRRADKLDAAVREYTWTVIADNVGRAFLPESVSHAGVDHAGDLRRAEEGLKELEDVYWLGTGPKMARARYEHLHQELELRVADCQDRLSRSRDVAIALRAPQTRTDFDAHWENSGVEWQRSMVSIAVERVIIHPSGKGKPFDLKDIEIVMHYAAS